MASVSTLHRLVLASGLALGAAGAAAAPVPSGVAEPQAIPIPWPPRVRVEEIAPQHLVRAPHYGDVLFHFYQSRYFSSVTSLMVSQQFARLAPHDDEAEVLRGGLYLSYGLHKEAGEIFAKLIEKGAEPPVRDRAWYFLAKIRYQRGLYDEAQQALDRIAGALPPALAEERTLLVANVQMARGDWPAAVRTLETLAADAQGTPYARYNLGVALIKSGDPAAQARGTTLLDAFGKAPAAGEELRSLRDRANVALGFTALQSGDPVAARGYLERVRLQGMQASRALLGFGWAAAAQKEPKAALVSWQEVAGRAAVDPAVLEARLAVPYAYAELGALGQSLALYEQAIAGFNQEDGALDESIAAIRGGRLVDGLLARNPGEEMGWFWSIDQLPDMPHAAHLAPVLAEHAFQEAFKNLRDLQFIGRNLRGWQDKLAVYGDMLDNRRQAFAQRLPQALDEQQGRAQELEALARQREALGAELAAAGQAGDGQAFADPRQRDLAERIARGEAVAGTRWVDHATAEQLAAARERLRRVAGALAWELAQDFPEREWRAKRGLRDTDAALADARARAVRLQTARTTEPEKFARFAQRIADLEQRLKAMLPQVDTLVAEQQQFVQEVAVAGLVRQKERLALYATQARFAVAQLYDRAHAGKEAGDAPKPQ